ncbi:MAG: 16S rRNA (cytosine(1402)-N(4))-methyltransferase, partial [Candidatus Hinthialibacter sp.]
QSVLPEEVLDCLEAVRKGRYLDGTFGGGGHTRRILRSHEDNFVHGLDRDPEAALRAVAFREEYGARFEFSRGSFCQIEIWASEEWDGILFDLGEKHFG